MKTPASFAVGRQLLASVGIEPRHYQLLVDLFETLGDRKEVFGSLGLDRRAMHLTTLALVLPGGFLALFAFGPISLANYNMTTLAITSFMLLLLVVMEAANSFFNPARDRRSCPPAHRQRHICGGEGHLPRARRPARRGRAQWACRPGGARER